MGLLTTLLRPDRSTEVRGRVGESLHSPANDPSGLLEGLLGGGGSSSGRRVTAQNAMTVSAMYAAVRLLSSSIAQLPIHVVKRLENGDREKQHSHRVRMLLNDAPNEWLTAMEYRELVTSWAVMHGNAVSWLNLRGNLDIEEIVPLPPDRVRFWLTPDGTRMVYEYVRPNGQSWWLPRLEVFHLRAPLGTQWLGLGLLQIAKEAIGLTMAAEEHAARFYSNAAAPAGVLVSPKKLSDPAFTKLRQQWEARHKGPENAFRTALLEDGVEWKPLGLNLRDQQFIETRTFQVQEIARVVGLPPHLIGELSRSTNNNIEAQGIEVVRYALQPWCTRWEQRIKLDLFGVGEQRRLYVKHSLDAFTRGELLNRYRSYQIGRMGGWLSVNDVREYEDLNGIGPDGDKYMAPLNMIPANLFGEEPTPEEAPVEDPAAAPGTQPGGVAPSAEDARARVVRSVVTAAPVMLDVATRVHRRAAGERERSGGSKSSAFDFAAWAGQAVEPVLRSLALTIEVPGDEIDEAVSMARDAVAGAWLRADQADTPQQYAQRALEIAGNALYAHTLNLIEA